MGRGDELHAPLGDGAGGGGFLFRPHFINDDSLGHVVFHRLDHHAMLLRRRSNLHPPGPSDGRVRHVAVAGYLVGGVNNYDPLLGLDRQDSGRLAQHGSLADSRPAQQQDILAGEGQVFYHLDGAKDSASDAAGQPDDLPPAVANGRNAMQGTLDASPVVVAELAQPFNDGLQIGGVHFLGAKRGVAADETGFRLPAQIQYDFKQFFQVFTLPKRCGNTFRQHVQHKVQLFPHCVLHRRQYHSSNGDD